MSEPPPRPDYVRIAVLEHDLLGIQPRPGTAAALIVKMRRAGTCLAHQPVDTSILGDPAPTGLCGRCGHAMVLGSDGNWTTA
ncbi:hypothetical protein [Streptomyces griseofuscus]|uniref:hypothetical protein n=1 Tax=Streptomyces griseofuscus TaxID=146922 RepID=UPI0033FF3093